MTVQNTSSIDPSIESEKFSSFPDINAGVADEFADAYSEISEAPRQFYLMAYLTCLGSTLSIDIKIKTLLKVSPRLYVVFLGVSGRGRKSTPIDISCDFFKNLLPDDFNLMHHANSGEGLGVFLEKHNCTLLTYDEFLGFVSKASQKGNTLLGTVTSLFEKNQYQTATKDKQLVIENANLSILSACTMDTWERCWSADFTAIGLENRLFIVPGKMDKLVAIPPDLDISKWKKLRQKTLSAIQTARKMKEYDFSLQAKTRYENWYLNELDHHSLHSVRLETYAMRLMLLLCACREEFQINESVVEDSIKLVNWQHEIRQLYDPLDADNEMAKAEERIRRVLSTGSKTPRELQQKTNASRTGLWIWKNALENLQKNEEVILNPKTKKYMAANIL